MGRIVLVLTITAISYVITLKVIRYAMKKGVIDTPNERSSHIIPTPRGGGLSIVLLTLIGTLVIVIAKVLPIKTGLALLIGGSAVGLVGWIDDKRHLGAGIRFLIHMTSSLWAVIMLGGLPPLHMAFINIESIIILFCLATVGIVWSINLYNFMDGIDGLAGIQAVCVGIGSGILLTLYGEISLAYCMYVLGAAALGFLVLNWHPAKIFMGDVCSGFIGFYIAAIAIASCNNSAMPLPLWIIIMAVFIIDATATLIYRIIKRYPIFEAHCTHVYQLATRNGLSHNRVALTVGIIDCILIGIAYIGFMYPTYAGSIMAITLAVVFLAWLLLRHKFKAQLISSSAKPIAQQGIMS